jgi:taurine dioxygenase
MTLDIRPLPVGADVWGLDCSQPISGAAQAELYAAWLQHGFLIFREPVESTADQIRLSRCFGEIEKHPLPEMWVKDEPYLIQLGGDARGVPYVIDGDLRINPIAWHRDTAYTLNVCKGGALRMLETPPEGGATILADTAMAYDELPESTKRRIENLEVKVTYTNPGNPPVVTRGAPWKSARHGTKEDWPEEMKRQVSSSEYKRFPPVIQPVVITHPESGRKCLYISPTYADSVLGLSHKESEELLDELVGHMTKPKYCYEHNWAPLQVALWDNRRCMHAAPGYHPKYRRSGHRTTLAGSLNSGRYFDSADAEGASEFAPVPD